MDDDVKLVKASLDGDRSGFETIVDKYKKTVFNIAIRVINDYDDAEDITQIVFIKAYENLETFDSKHKFFSWLYRIAINESLNFLNQKKRFEEIDTENLSTEEKNPEENYYHSEVSRNIEKALMDLNIDYRLVVILRHFQGLSYDEIGYVLDVPEKTIKSRLFTARSLLKDILSKKGMIE